MKKRLLSAWLALCLLAACAGRESSGIGEPVSTFFLDFTVDSAKATSSYAGYQPPQGFQLLEVVVTTVNTYDYPIDLYQTDYELRWGNEEETANSAITLQALDETMAPLSQPLATKESVTYHYIYEVPAGISKFRLCYAEQTQDSSGTVKEGPLFTVSFSI